MDDAARRERDKRDAESWSEAALDPDFLTGVDALAAIYAADDLAAWDA